jgi:hypothetical protein
MKSSGSLRAGFVRNKLLAEGRNPLQMKQNAYK